MILRIKLKLNLYIFYCQEIMKRAIVKGSNL